jgi:hypothetical protein
MEQRWKEGKATKGITGGEVAQSTLYASMTLSE